MPLRNNYYGVLMIDPPWPKSKGGKRKTRPNQGKSLDYETLSIEEIGSLLDTEVFPKAKSQHTVFLWTVDEFLPAAEQLMRAREYRLHCRMIWDKTNGIAPAFSVRFSHEYLLWYYKPKFMPVSTTMRGKYCTVFREQARQHSRKPEIAYEIMASLFPSEKKLDVFSREKREGWSQFGNQLNHFT